VGSRFKKVVGHQHSNHFLPSSSTFCCLGLSTEGFSCLVYWLLVEQEDNVLLHLFLLVGIFCAVIGTVLCYLLDVLTASPRKVAWAIWNHKTKVARFKLEYTIPRTLVLSYKVKPLLF
jgi:hypothetical protein